VASILTHRLGVAALLAFAGLLFSCGEGAPVLEGTARVEIKGRTFELEIVADQASRVKGMGGRGSVPESGGMLFVFPESRVRRFIMRDCLVDLDIIFLDAAGRVVATHHMPVEEPRREDETLAQYERRLTQYPSRFNSKYVIEIRGGLLEELGLEAGDLIALATETLDAMAS